MISFIYKYHFIQEKQYAMLVISFRLEYMLVFLYI